MFCKYCGYQIKAKDGRCQTCGHELDKLEGYRMKYDADGRTVKEDTELNIEIDVRKSNDVSDSEIIKSANKYLDGKNQIIRIYKAFILLVLAIGLGFVIGLTIHIHDRNTESIHTHGNIISEEKFKQSLDIE